MGRLAPPLSRAGALRNFLRNQRAFISSLAFFILMIAAFAAISPSIWSKPTVYSAVAISLPTLSIIAVALVFVVAAGEIDLSFGAAVTFSGLVFSYSALAGTQSVLGGYLGRLGGHWNWTDQRGANCLYWPFVAYRHSRNELLLGRARRHPVKRHGHAPRCVPRFLDGDISSAR